MQTFLLKHHSSVQLSLSRVRLFATPWIAAHQASLSITNSQSLPKLMSIQLVMPSSHLILCHSLLLLPPIPPSIRVFSNESTLRNQVIKKLIFTTEETWDSELNYLLQFIQAINSKEKFWTKLAGMQHTRSLPLYLLPAQEIIKCEE